MTVPEQIMAAFAHRGVRHYFGIPGSGFLMDLMEAGRTRGIELITTANESSAAVAAAYYGRLRGTAGLAIAIQGPGAANLASGAALAWFERMPVVCLCERPPVGETNEQAQRCDQPGLFGSVVKDCYTIHPDRPAGAIIEAAVDCATSGRPGPVLLEVPQDAAGDGWQSAGLDRNTTVTGHAEASAPASAPESTSEASYEQAAAFIAGLKRPVVIAGGDLLRSRASEQLRQLVHLANAAVLVGTDARGSFPENDSRFAGVFPNLKPSGALGNRVLRHCDGVVIIGFDPLAAEAPWQHDLPVCQVAIEQSVSQLVPSPEITVTGDLRIALEGVIRYLQRGAGEPGVGRTNGFDPEDIASLRLEVEAAFARPEGNSLTIQDIIAVSRDILPDEGVLFAETGAFVLMLEYLWRCRNPGTFFGTAGGRTMGLTLPALLGGKTAKPDVPMMGIGGDGSTLMRLGELEAFARTGISAPIVVVNDSALGTIKSRQKSRGLPEYGLRLGSVDFAALAESVGLAGVTAETIPEFRTALSGAFEANRATVIDARVDGEIYRNSFGPTTGA